MLHVTRRTSGVTPINRHCAATAAMGACPFYDLMSQGNWRTCQHTVSTWEGLEEVVSMYVYVMIRRITIARGA